MTAIPLTDLGSAEYLGFEGGLYPRGKNSRPVAYEEAGIALANTVKPLSRSGKPSGAGKIVMLAVGMSNASHEFSQLIRLVEADPRKHPNLVMIDVAREGAAAPLIAVQFSNYWKGVELKLEREKISPEQVQVVWLKTALSHDPRTFPENARVLEHRLRSILGTLSRKFPQLKLVYLSSRTYGGYSQIDLSPEPTAYESGFAVKWLIEERINNPTPGRSTPWVSWGPYLWANGMSPRSDGLTWEASDFEPDGAHPSEQGALKVARKLFEFFENDPTAKPWFFSGSHRRGKSSEAGKKPILARQIEGGR